MIAFELELRETADREAVVRELKADPARPLVVLDTCQRLECFGFVEPEHEQVHVSRTWRKRDAFEHLARVAAGLESRILGELEVLGQVRLSYKAFREQGLETAPELDRIFQEALALARRARRESGVDRNLTSLSAIASRQLLDRVPAGAPLVVVGAGSLAGSVARYLSKRGEAPVRISSRCPDNAIRLALEVGGFGTGLDDLGVLFRDAAGIITATAAPHAVVYDHHLADAASEVTLVDMGVPPDCDDSVRRRKGLTYVSLAEVEDQAQINRSERRGRARVAEGIIRDGATTWAMNRS